MFAGMPLAYAQAGRAARRLRDEVGLEEVVVTAQKREENLQDVPISSRRSAPQGSKQLHVSTSTTTRSSCPACLYTSFGAGLLAHLSCAASQRRERQPLRLRCPASASISTNSRSPPSRARSTSTSTTSRASRRSPGRRARSTARARRPAPSASSPTSPTRPVRGRLRPGGQHGRARRRRLRRRGLRQLPARRQAAVRLVGWALHDAGYIDNVAGSRHLSRRRASPSTTPTSSKKNYNDVDTYGARAALQDRPQRQLDGHAHPDGAETEGERRLRLRSAARRPQGRHASSRKTRTTSGVQAALTIEGKVGNLDVTYAGAYLKRGDDDRLGLLRLQLLLRHRATATSAYDDDGNHRPVAVHPGQGPLQEAQPRAPHRRRRRTSRCGSSAACSTSARSTTSSSATRSTTCATS